MISIALLDLVNGGVVLGAVGLGAADDPDIGGRRVDALDAFGQVALQPGGTTAKWPAPVPDVRLPGAAKTSVHMSIIGSK